jgi:hypothetical protein
VPRNEILDPDEEVVVVATRAGLGGLLHDSATQSGGARSIADLPPPGPAPSVVPFDGAEAVATLKRRAARLRASLPPREPRAPPSVDR